ncbi:MAG: prolyl oligopeptidase family serine peptidase [Phycisphaeraceae bacterium]
MSDLSNSLVAAAILVPLVCFALPGTAQAQAVWVEGEVFSEAREDVERQVIDRSPASGGRGLYGATLDGTGHAAAWEFDLPTGIDDAVVSFRYARLHWRDTMMPARFELELAGPGEPIRREIAFDDTGGWGQQAQHYSVLAAELGALPAGRWRLTLRSLAELNSVTVDGFLIAPAEVSIADEPLSSFARLTITHEGYVGLRSAGVVQQTDGGGLWAAAAAFDGRTPELTATLRGADGASHQLAPGQTTPAADGQPGAVRFALGELPDGKYELVLTSEHPAAQVATELTLAGQFLGSLDERIEALAAFAQARREEGGGQAAGYGADFEHIVELTRAARGELSGQAQEAGNPFRAALAEHEGAADSAPVLGRVRRALEQAEAARQRLEAGQEAYAGVAGELRRAFHSAADSRQHVYRMFVPNSYASAESVPLVLFLHGGGGDENYWPEMEDGRVLEILEQRGYMAIMPRWHRRTQEYWLQDMMQLINLVASQWSKVDEARIYITGISMGGGGTYGLAMEHPDFFAAAAPVSSGGRREQAERLRGLPVLIIHGEDDPVSSPDGARAMAARLDELDYPHELHMFPRQGHGYVPGEYLPLTLDWFDRYTRDAAR